LRKLGDIVNFFRIGVSGDHGQPTPCWKVDSDPCFACFEAAHRRTDPLDRGREGPRDHQRLGPPETRNALAPSGETGHAHDVDSADAPVRQVHDGHGVRYLQDTARERRNVFEALMEAVKDPFAGADQPCAVRCGWGVSKKYVMYTSIKSQPRSG